MKRLLLYLAFVAMVIADSVVLFKGYQKYVHSGQGRAHAMGNTHSTIGQIHRALAHFLDYDEKGFEDLTARRLTLLSSNVLASYPSFLEICTNIYSLQLSAEKDVLDLWDQPY